ncbi:DedA family protein [Marinactinospora rubrisoli]|uniref:DedA family protein n=1 Tax=Marinactinospora rubrisoli TaxID=2715399 RepID=A0ABW2KEU0_9ACTN
MPYEFLEGRPFWVVYAALLGIVFARAQATYWIGRGIGAGVHRSGLARRLGERLTRAERLIDRFGPPAVTLSFLTVGIQTAVNLAAGAMRMSFPRYLAAMFVGCLAWAAVYSLGGMAVIGAWWSLFLRSPLLAVTVAVLAGAAVVGIVLWRRRSRSSAGAPSRQEPAQEETTA